VKEFERRLGPLWRPGELGHSSLVEAEQKTTQEFGLQPRQIARLTGDIWIEYLGELNTELAGYFRALKPRYRTGLLSNSLVGAREREREATDLRTCAT